MKNDEKLTDEKALFNYIANDICGSVKPLYLRKRIVVEILDLTHSLQSENANQKAEIERLTKDKDHIFKEFEEVYKELEDCVEDEEQAVKDTAKEILQTIKRAKENGQMYYNESFMITAQKAYGVEVE